MRRLGRADQHKLFAATGPSLKREVVGKAYKEATPCKLPTSFLVRTLRHRMSFTTPSHGLDALSGAVPVSSQPPVRSRSSIERTVASISALAIEVHQSRMGCAVFVEEEHQLLLCEDLSCAFAFDGRDQLPSVQNHDLHSEQGAVGSDESAAKRTAAAFGHPSYGFVDSCEHVHRSPGCPFRHFFVGLRGAHNLNIHRNRRSNTQCCRSSTLTSSSQTLGAQNRFLFCCRLLVSAKSACMSECTHGILAACRIDPQQVHSTVVGAYHSP